MYKVKDPKNSVVGIRVTPRVLMLLKEEAKEQQTTPSKFLSRLLEQRYENVNKLNPPLTAEEIEDANKLNVGVNANKLCYPIDKIEGKPLNAKNQVCLRGEIISYFDLINKRYRNYKTRIIKADYRGQCLNDIIEEIENE